MSLTRADWDYTLKGEIRDMIMDCLSEYKARLEHRLNNVESRKPEVIRSEYTPEFIAGLTSAIKETIDRKIKVFDTRIAVLEALANQTRGLPPIPEAPSKTVVTERDAKGQITGMIKMPLTPAEIAAMKDGSK